MDKQANEAIEQIVQIATTYGPDVLGALAILVIGWIAAGWASRATEKALARTRRIDLTLQHFFSSLVRYAVIVFTLLANHFFHHFWAMEGMQRKIYFYFFCNNIAVIVGLLLVMAR